MVIQTETEVHEEMIKNVNLSDKVVEVAFSEGNIIKFEDYWLRDNCRCSVCYHADTFQRAQHILNIPDSLVNEIHYNASQLLVTWDDKHESSYDADFLAQFDYATWQEDRRFKPVLWNSTEVSGKIARVHVDKFLHSTEGALSVFQSLLNYGVVLIEGVGVSEAATEDVCRGLGGIQHTLFGGLWKFTNRADDHADTAYTNIPLAVHNDNTYFTEPAGLQILHCLEHSNGSGGDTILVDGFYGATRLRERFPEDYDFLTTFNLEAEYLEEGHHHRWSAPVIQVDSKSKDIKQIRFNVYDRSPMAFSCSDECKKFYRSFKNLATFYEEPANQWQFKLTPGLVMAVDNFRVLHGRTGFSGTRVVCGGYVARSDWLDRARTLRLINLQILHCLEHSNGSGGDTILVDGFYGATRLRERFPEDYDFLTTFNLEAEYLEEGHHHRWSAPVIQVDSKSKDIKQIRFNVYDRSPMAFSCSDECKKFYRSFKNLATFYEEPANQWQFKLTPGLVMAVDNFRVLHGRTGFSGTRVVCGGYVARSDWLDRARTLRLIK